MNKTKYFNIYVEFKTLGLIPIIAHPFALRNLHPSPLILLPLNYSVTFFQFQSLINVSDKNEINDTKRKSSRFYNTRYRFDELRPSSNTKSKSVGNLY